MPERRKTSTRRPLPRKTAHKAELVYKNRRETQVMINVEHGLGMIPEPDVVPVPLNNMPTCSPAETTAYVEAMLETLYARGGPTAQIADAHARHHGAIASSAVVEFADVVAA